MNAPASIAAAAWRTYGRLSVQNGKYWVADLEPHVAMRLKALFPKLPKASGGPFLIGGDPASAADLAWFTSRYPLAAPPEVLGQLASDRAAFETTQAEVGRIMAPDYRPGAYAGLRPGQEVRVHQARAGELLARFGGLLVTDEVGQGKTYTAGAALLQPGALPGTVVCPPHLRLQWATKLQEFTTLKPVVVQGTKPYALPPADVRIFSYTSLQGWADHLELLGTGLAVFDEISELRNGRATEKGAAAGRLVDVARLRLGLDATPIYNYGDEIWQIMQFLRPDLLGELPDFLREWCGGSRQVTDPEALGSYLREQHALIRKRSDAPEPNVIVQTIDHDMRELEKVEDLARRLAVTARTGKFEERGQAVRELDMLLRQATGVAKARAVAAYVRILVEGGRPVILAGWHRAVYSIWLEELADFNPVLFTGSETPAQKESARQAFLSGLSQVFIMSLRSGKGVDGLQFASRTAVVGELDWSPSVHKQFFGRLNREGQACWPEPIDAIYLVADDGSDPPIIEINGLKASQAQGIVDPGLGPQRVTSNASPIEKLVQAYLERGARS